MLAAHSHEAEMILIVTVVARDGSVAAVCRFGAEDAENVGARLMMMVVVVLVVIMLMELCACVFVSVFTSLVMEKTFSQYSGVGNRL